MDWLKCLEREAKDIVRHGQGELRLQVSERQGKYISIQIFAGKRYDFIIAKDLQIQD